MNAHSHGLNDHTHTFTPSGTVSSSFTGSSVTSSDMSKNKEATFYVNAGGTQNPTGFISYTGRSGSTAGTTGGSYRINYSLNISHTHNVTAKGTVSSSFTGTSGTTSGNSSNTTSTISTGSFRGTAGTTKSNGSGTSFSIMPPYVVKYCFERTA